MKIKTLEVGPFQVNTYLLINEKRECLLVDPGGEGAEIINYLKENNFVPKGILLTHAHFDHIQGISAVLNEYSLPIYMSEKEKDWLKNATLNGSTFFPGLPKITVNNIGKVKFLTEGKQDVEGFQLKVLETPGHTPGCLCFFFEKEGILVTGDTLFREGIGRTDLPYGDHQKIIPSIKTKLLVLSNQTKVYPGHGPSSKIGHERESNPYL